MSSKREELKREVYRANMALPENDLVVLTWGNVSVVDRDQNVVYIKPSGVPYDKLTPENMVAVDLISGQCLEEGLKPSSDTPTHLALYRAFEDIGAIVHTHSPKATAWAQAKREIPAFGTTHADTFYGPVPCTRDLTPEEIESDYEGNTAKVIVEAFENLNPLDVPAALVSSHGPFVWAKTADKAVENARVLEEVARMAFETEMLGRRKKIDDELLEIHYKRKHGPNAYYGQD